MKTRSEALKAWFGNSAVCNEKGEALIVYHGSKADFTVFDESKQLYGWLGKGFYFSPNEEYAAALYGSAKAFYLKIENPFVVNGTEPNDVIRELKEINPSVDCYNIVDVLKELGYDGVCFNHWDDGMIYSAFYPHQIKSATDNVGTFDPENLDFRY